MAIRQIEDFLASVSMSKRRFVYGLEKVPDDRLNWSPGGSARTALALAGRQAGFLGFIAHMLRTKTRPDTSGGFPPPPETREAARAALEKGFDGLAEAARGLSEEDLEISLPAPWGTPMTLSQWLTMALSVMGYYQGQLNYLQLTYGDEEPNIPPEWIQRGG